MNRLSYAMLMVMAAATARAEWRCDCTRITGSCRAEVEVQGNWVNVQSSSQSCSRVDYFLDGQPFVTVVVDGEDKQNWLARTRQPQVLVQSCQVCQDNLLEPQAPAAAGPRTTLEPQAAEEQSTGLAPLIQMQPEYPPEARRQGIEGHVIVEFKVLPDGTTDALRIVEARPPGVFDRAVFEAVARWRYPAMQTREPVVQRERLEFGLNGAPREVDPLMMVGQQPQATPEPARDGRVLSRNECIREAAAFDFTDRVEVQLVNACREPVLVYVCAAGLREYSGQWVCPGEPVALIGPDDPRVGQRGLIATNRGEVRFRYAPAFELARAPRSELWRIGCALSDLDCHEAAVGWREYLDLKPSDVNPRQGSAIAAASSQ